MSGQAAVAGRSWAERLAAFGDGLGDRVNPLVVKETRQGLRTRVFWSSFSLLLIACVVISLVAYARVDETAMRGTSDGAFFFYAFLLCLGAVNLLVLPYSAYRSLAREREDETWVLLTLTGLGPRRIIWGKLLSSLVQGLLYASAILPFLLLSYYLNGIALPTILLVTALGWMLQVGLTLFSVCMATFADGRVFRGSVNVALMFLLLMVFTTCAAAVDSLIKSAPDIVREKQFYSGFALVLWGAGSTGWLVFEVSAARLSLYTENYARGPRLALLAQVLGTLAIWVGFWVADARDIEMLAVMQVCICEFLTFVGLFMALDVDGQAACHRAKRGLGRAFTPGALRGFRFIAALLVFTTAVSLALTGASSTSRHGGMRGLLAGVLAVPAYGLVYLSLPILITRTVRGQLFANPVFARVLAVGLFAAGSIFPWIAGEVLRHDADSLLINALNPVVGLGLLLDRETGPEELLVLSGLLVLALVLTLLADRALAKRDLEPSRAP